MTTPHAASGSTSTGLAPNVAGALAYVLGPITGVLFYVLEKDNRFVRFHASQSIVVGLLIFALSIALSIVATVLAFVPVLGWLAAVALSLLVGVGSLLLWIALIWRAFKGDEWELPVAGGYARRLASQTP